jgi:hypothetical protein
MVQIVGQTNHRAQELSPHPHLQDANTEHCTGTDRRTYYNHRAQEQSTRLHRQYNYTEHRYRSSDRPITELKSCPPVSICNTIFYTEHRYRSPDRPITELKSCPHVSIGNTIIQNTGTDRRTDQSQSSRAVPPSPSARR